jgi:hypothetical protein
VHYLNEGMVSVVRTSRYLSGGKMKKILVGTLMVFLGLLLMAPVASAYSLQAGDTIKLTSGYGNANGGGAFTVKDLSGASLFTTFCVEYSEHIWLNTPVFIGSISAGAKDGGVSGGGAQHFDPISEQTAYLYSRWATGAIAHNAANANALHLAIWNFEGELAFTGAPTLSALAADFISQAGSSAVANNFYGVQVLNLYDSNNHSLNRQDQLVYNPVPEPGTILLLGVGLLGLAVFGKRRMNREI